MDYYLELTLHVPTLKSPGFGHQGCLRLWLLHASEVPIGFGRTKAGTRPTAIDTACCSVHRRPPAARGQLSRAELRLLLRLGHISVSTGSSTVPGFKSSVVTINFFLRF